MKPTADKLCSFIAAKTRLKQAWNTLEIARHFRTTKQALKPVLANLRAKGDIRSPGKDETGHHVWVYVTQRQKAASRKTRRRRNPESPERKAMRKAEAWFWDKDQLTEPRPLRTWQPPNAAIEVGHIVAIEYESKKDGQSEIYRHDVTGLKKLHISTDGSTLIIQPPFKITKRGIEG